MATTVNAAFDEFMAGIVNLDSGETGTARASRDWLSGQLNGLHQTYTDFPVPYATMHTYFGSFHRRTKVRPLDDIDLISCLSAEGSTYGTYGNEIRIQVPTTAERLLSLCHESTNELNSRKVINQFVNHLAAVPQYRRADIGRDGEAAVLSLESYPWSFDVVPAMFTKPEYDGRTYFLIPDGNGQWKKADPRIDQDRVTNLNQARAGYVLAPIRLIKYWNRRPTMPTISSYLIESIILSHYEAGITASQFVDLEVAPILTSIALAILSSVADPKGIQGDINTTPLGDRFAVWARASQDAAVAGQARQQEVEGNHQESIRLWGTIVGPAFPSFG